MLDFARLPLSERNPYFDEAAERRDSSRRIIEKDFWVCFALRLLFSMPAVADKFVFKGGTSLSKVFGIIKRFSEDVDLSIDPDWLGFGGDNRPDDRQTLRRNAPACGSTELVEALTKFLNAPVVSKVEPPVVSEVATVDGRQVAFPQAAISRDTNRHLDAC